jgi:YVTN family beta-propeller protein
MEFRILGPLEGVEAGRPVAVQAGRPPALGRQPTFWTRKRLGVAAALLVLAGATAAAFDRAFIAGGKTAAVPPNTVAVVDVRAGRVSASIPVGVAPQALAVGAGGVWVANTADRTVSRIDPRTLGLVLTIPVGDYPSDIAVAGGRVFVASGPRGRLVEIDPEANRASQPQSTGGGCDGFEESMAVGAGSLWLACDRTPDAVRIRLAPRTVIPFAYRAGLLTSASRAIVPHFSAVAFGDGVLWIADRAQSRLIEIDPATGLPIRQIAVGSDPAAIAIGFGSVWVANQGNGTVTRIQPGGSARSDQSETIRVGARPVDVAVGEDSVWVANAGGRSVSRIDPEANRVTATIPLRNPPAGIATGEGRVWVTVGEP